MVKRKALSIVYQAAVKAVSESPILTHRLSYGRNKISAQIVGVPHGLYE
jgi:hypothetical protein